MKHGILPKKYPVQLLIAEQLGSSRRENKMRQLKVGNVVVAGPFKCCGERSGSENKPFTIYNLTIRDFKCPRCAHYKSKVIWADGQGMSITIERLKLVSKQNGPKRVLLLTN